MKKIISLILTIAVIALYPCVSSFAETAVPDIAYIPQWNEQTVTEKFSGFTCGNSHYSSTGKEIDISLTGKKLGDIDMTGYDIYEDKTYCVKAEKYAINNISDECAVAVKFKEGETYYVYKNVNYFPDTLGELIDALDLENTVSFGSMYQTNGKEVKDHKDYDKSLVKQLIADNKDSEMNKNYDTSCEKISFSVNVDILGIKNKSLGITKDGYLTTNIMEWGYAFYIGEEAAGELFDSLNISFDAPAAADTEPAVTTSAPAYVEEKPIETVTMTTAGYVPDAATKTTVANTTTKAPEKTTAAKIVDTERVKQLNIIYEQLKQFKGPNTHIFYKEGISEYIEISCYYTDTETIEKIKQYIAGNNIDESLVEFYILESAAEAPVTEPSDIPEETAVRGDISGDGKLNISDAVMFQKYLTGKLDSIPGSADLNNDGTVNVFDYIILKHLILS